MIRVSKKAYKLGALLYFFAIIYATFFLEERHEGVNYRAYANFYFFSKIYSFDRLYWINQYKFVFEIILNVLMFIPAFPAVYTLTGKIYKRYINIGIILMLTFSIELCQYIFNVGVFDIDDIFLNSIGGILGIFMLKRKIELGNDVNVR